MWIFFKFVSISLAISLSYSAILSGQEISAKLKAIVIHSSSKNVVVGGYDSEAYKGINFLNVYPPDPSTLVEKLTAFIDQPFNKEDLENLKQQIILHYRDGDYPVVDVFESPQSIRNDIIQLVALESKLDKLLIEGNQYFSSEQIENFLDLKSGEKINQKDLNSKLEQLNKNPYKTVDISYEDGEEKASTNAIVNVDDKIPLKYTITFEDTGNAITEDERLTASFNWGNVLNKGHVLNYSYSGDPMAKYLKSHSLSYSINFPWGHDLSLSANYARNGADLPDPSLNVGGKSWGGSLNYTLPLPSIFNLENYVQTLTAGYNFSRSNNLLEFNQIQVSNTLTDTSEFKFTYSGNAPDPLGFTIFSSTLTYSPGGMTGHNSDAELITAGSAGSNYSSLLFNLNRITLLPQNWTWNATAQYQMASSNLPGGGKMGSGGFMTLPGYDEREANGDRGFIFFTDLTTPPVSLSKFFKKEWADQISGRFFWGYSDIRVKQINESSINPNISMMSIGSGIRYNVGPFVNFRFDHGWQLKDSDTSPLTRRAGNSRGHFSLSVSY